MTANIHATIHRHFYSRSRSRNDNNPEVGMNSLVYDLPIVSGYPSVSVFGDHILVSSLNLLQVAHLCSIWSVNPSIATTCSVRHPFSQEFAELVKLRNLVRVQGHHLPGHKSVPVYKNGDPLSLHRCLWRDHGEKEFGKRISRIPKKTPIFTLIQSKTLQNPLRHFFLWTVINTIPQFICLLYFNVDNNVPVTTARRESWDGYC